MRQGVAVKQDNAATGQAMAALGETGAMQQLLDAHPGFNTQALCEVYKTAQANMQGRVANGPAQAEARIFHDPVMLARGQECAQAKACDDAHREAYLLHRIAPHNKKAMTDYQTARAGLSHFLQHTCGLEEADAATRIRLAETQARQAAASVRDGRG